jgi:hypothetical protein
MLSKILGMLPSRPNSRKFLPEEYLFPCEKAPHLGRGNECIFTRLPVDRVDPHTGEPRHASDLPWRPDSSHAQTSLC